MISPDVQIADLRKLAAAVLTQALTDLKRGDPVRCLDALAFLTSDDFPWWAEWAGMPDADAIPMLTSGKLRRLGSFAARGRA